MKTWVIFPWYLASCDRFRNIATLLWPRRKLLPKIGCHSDMAIRPMRKKNVAWNNIACCHRQHNAQERSKRNNNKSIQWKRIACTMHWTLWKMRREKLKIMLRPGCSSHRIHLNAYYSIVWQTQCGFALLTIGIITRRYAKKTTKNIEKINVNESVAAATAFQQKDRE